MKLLSPLYLLTLLFVFSLELSAAPRTGENAKWNVNFQKDGSDPSKYYGEWPGHSYFPSPEDWRGESVYHVMLDRFFDGDPRNNNGAHGGFDVKRIGQRHGGDFVGLTKKLDYIKGLGVTAIWLSPIFQNGHNGYHGYHQLDYTLLDDRFGTLEEFRTLVKEAHKRGIRIIVDVIVNHLANLYHAEGLRGQETPFRIHNNEYILKPYNKDFVYEDFKVVNEFDPFGKYCDVYNQKGELVVSEGRGTFTKSDLHHNGNLRNYYDPFQIHYGKIYGALDDVRTSQVRVQDMIIAMTKSLIASTDIDGIRMDTPMQVPNCFFKRWSPAVRNFAASIGKKNFGLFPETYCGMPLAGTLIGRGVRREQGERAGLIEGETIFDGGIDYVFFRTVIEEAFKNGNLEALQNTAEAIQVLSQNYDYKHHALDEERDRMLRFYNNHDQRKICSYKNGIENSRLSNALITFVPGIPLYYYGDEQGLCSYGTALSGWAREAMMTSVAWKDHPSPFNVNPASKDNFDMTHPIYREMRDLLSVRESLGIYTVDSLHNVKVDGEGGEKLVSLVRGKKKGKGPAALLVFNPTDQKLTGQITKKALLPFFRDAPFLVKVYPRGKEGKIEVKDGKLTVSLEPFEYVIAASPSARVTLPLQVVEVDPYHDQPFYSPPTAITLKFSRALDSGTVPSSVQLNGEPIERNGIYHEEGSKTVRVQIGQKLVREGVNKIQVLPTLKSSSGDELGFAFESRFRFGPKNNPLVNRAITRDKMLIAEGATIVSPEEILLSHPALGADYFRVSESNGYKWSEWQEFAPTSKFSFSSKKQDWRTLDVQYFVDGSAAYFLKDGVDVSSRQGMSNY